MIYIYVQYFSTLFSALSDDLLVGGGKSWISDHPDHPFVSLLSLSVIKFCTGC